MSVRAVIYAHVASIAEQNRKTLPPLTDSLVILDTAFDSLCYALLVATLDDEYNVSPLDQDGVEAPVTFGDLIRLYQQAVDHVAG